MRLRPLGHPVGNDETAATTGIQSLCFLETTHPTLRGLMRHIDARGGGVTTGWLDSHHHNGATVQHNNRHTYTHAQSVTRIIVRVATDRHDIISPTTRSNIHNYVHTHT